LLGPHSQVRSFTLALHQRHILTITTEGEKGVGQKATDATSGSGSSGKPVTEQASDMAGNAANTVKDTLGMSS